MSYALNRGGPPSDELAAWLTTPGEPDEEELTRMAALIEAAGGRDWALAEAARRAALAEEALSGVELDAGAREELLALGRFVVDREV
ncbi:Polyprenyl synthetase family protein OS=Streptomyces alboniger OX=132473 GN=CP975_31250 PE=3 SV=1 [Streptomyces alboniger]